MIAKIKSDIDEIITLLRLDDSSGWLTSFEKLKIEFDVNPVESARKVLSFYGGMGSFNETLLYKDCVILKEQNTKLSFLKDSLYERCKLLLSQ